MSTRRRPNSRSPRGIVSSGGVRIESKHRHHAEIPSLPPGEHLWMMLGIWRVADPATSHHDLDIENLITLEGPGCFLCEQQFSPEVAALPCPGEATP